MGMNWDWDWEWEWEMRDGTEMRRGDILYSYCIDPLLYAKPRDYNDREHLWTNHRLVLHVLEQG